MNERIKQLAIRAGLDADLDLSLANQPLESFAELIVRECADIDFRYQVGLSTDVEFEISQTIKEHFGVE